MLGKNSKKKTRKIDTLIGPQTKVAGDIDFGGGLHVDAVVKGKINADNDDHAVLSLSEQGSIEGDISVPYAILNGNVTGSVHCREHLELASKAHVEGDVHYNLVEIAAGAQVNGRLIHTPNVRSEASPAVKPKQVAGKRSELDASDGLLSEKKPFVEKQR